MRISVWSSDVCSSDLIAGNLQTLPACAQRDILARDLCSQSETRIVRIGLRRAELRARRLDVPSRAAEEINLPQRVEPREEQRRGFGLSARHQPRSEEHTSELQSLMRISYAVFCLKKKKRQH